MTDTWIALNNELDVELSSVMEAWEEVEGAESLDGLVSALDRLKACADYAYWQAWDIKNGVARP